MKPNSRAGEVCIEYTTYRIEVSPRSPLRLPEFPGSLVRGTFGKSLRELACATRLPTCDRCPVAASCVYRQVFDPVPSAGHPLQKFSAVPAPFVLQMPEWGARPLDRGSTFSFHLTLVGTARRHLSLVVLALQRALEAGWTQRAVRLDLRGVHAESPGGEVSVLDLDRRQLREHAATARLEPMPWLGEVKDTTAELYLDTPARLIQRGRPAAADTLEARTWLVGLVRRVALLADLHGRGGLITDFRQVADAARRVAIVQRQLEWREWERYSGRQRQSMPMGGLVGRVALLGPLAPFLPIATFAQRLNVGKHASFGLGAFRIQSLAG